MDWNEVWEILGIEPTGDKRLIRRTYAALSREHHMEEEPELFTKISEAYRQALEATGTSFCKSATEDVEAASSRGGASEEDKTASSRAGTLEEDGKEPPGADGDAPHRKPDGVLTGEEEIVGSSLLAQLEEAEEEKLQETFSQGALSELIAILEDSRRNNQASVWREYFLSEAFLEKQFDESFGEGLWQYLGETPDDFLHHLPQNFIKELVIAFGILPDAVKVGEAKRDKRGNEYWDCIYRVNGEGSFSNRRMAAELFNCQDDPDGENSKRLYHLLVTKPENRLRSYAFSKYIKLRKLNAEGHLGTGEREMWERLLLGGTSRHLYERNGREQEDGYTQSECFILLLEYWVRTEWIPEDVLCFMYHTYALRDIAHSSVQQLYGGLKEAILQRLPEIEDILYAPDSIRERRSRWKKKFLNLLCDYHENYDNKLYEETEDIKKGIYALFDGEDWNVLKQDEITFQEIHSALANRLVTPGTMADFLLDFYEREGDFAEPEKLWELTLGLLRSKGFIRRVEETDSIRAYVYTKTEKKDIHADNEQFLVYLLSRGFGNRYIAVIGDQEKTVPYIHQNRFYLSAFLDEIYHPFFVGDEQWNPTPGWQKRFTRFDEEEDGISEPVRDEVTLPDGGRLVVEFHLHYILYYWNDAPVVEPVLHLADLEKLSGRIENPVHFLYLLAVTAIEESERIRARELIYGWLAKTCIYPQLQPILAQLLSCDNARLPVEENEAKRVVALCYGEQERFCFRMTVCRRNVKLYRQTRYGWEEMKLLDGEGKQAKALDIEGKIDFCREKLRRLRQPKPVRISHRDVRALSPAERARAIIDAMKEQEIAQRGRQRPYAPGFPWRPDEITASVREFFRRDGGWMTEGYCVLHMGDQPGRQFDRVFWAKMNIFGFDLGFMAPEFVWSLNSNTAKLSGRITEKHLVVGCFGWGKRYAPTGWMEPMALAVGESGTFYMHDFMRLYQAPTLEELFAKVYRLWDQVTEVDVYQGKLSVSKFDHALEYCYTQEDYQAWLDGTRGLPDTFTKFGI